MRHYKACSWVIALTLIGCGDDGSPEAQETDGTGTGTGTDTTATTQPPTTTTMTTAGTTDETTDPTDPTSTGTETGATETGETETADDTGTGTDTGEVEPVYPACDTEAMPASCPRGFDFCITYPMGAGSLCSVDCMDETDCPQPESGTAPAICAGPQNNQCSLDCSGDAVCPDGMECISFGPGGNIERCAWPTE